MQHVLALAIVTASVLASACNQSPTWRGREFREVRSLHDLPASVLRGLFVVAGSATVADAGEPFNRSDLIENPRWPSRRFARAATSGDTWVVAYEQGGFAYGVHVLLFDAPTAAPQDLGSHPRPPTSLRELLALLPE